MSLIRHHSVIPPHRAEQIDRLIRVVHDHPKPGVVFRDVSPVLARKQCFEDVICYMSAPIDIIEDLELVAGLDARGFIFGGAMARDCYGFVPVRKPGKLPPQIDREAYDLEYGKAAFEIPVGLVNRGQRVVIVDDVLATSGSARGAARLLQRQGAVIAGFSFMVEIEALGGREVIAEYFPGVPVHALLTY